MHATTKNLYINKYQFKPIYGKMLNICYFTPKINSQKQWVYFSAKVKIPNTP